MDDFYAYLVWDLKTNTHHPLYYKLEDLMSTFALNRLVKDPTHVNQTGADILLDLVLTSSENQVDSCEVLPPPPLLPDQPKI